MWRILYASSFVISLYELSSDSIFKIAFLYFAWGVTTGLRPSTACRNMMSLLFLHCASADFSKSLRFKDLLEVVLILVSSIFMFSLNSLMLNSIISFSFGGAPVAFDVDFVIVIIVRINAFCFD